MKGRFTLTIATAIFAGAAAFMAARFIGWSCSCCSSSAVVDNVAFLTKELDLKPEQAGEIRKLVSELESRLESQCSSQCRSRTSIAEVVVLESGQEREEAVIAEMGRAYMESERATIDNIRKVRALLNPVQKARFDELISACVCESCARCSRHEDKTGAAKCK
jgi:hypothetical protein